MKIGIERKEQIEKELKISQNIDIKEIEKEKVPVSNDEALKVTFNFTIDYSKDSAKIEFVGNLIILPEKEETKKILKSWKDKKFTDEFRIPLFNFIMSKCNIKALALEDEMGLPFHIPMPRLSPEQQNPNK